VGRWAGGQVGRWAGGQVGRWAHDHWSWSPSLGSRKAYNNIVINIPLIS
jgi:hypothetical protein